MKTPCQGIGKDQPILLLACVDCGARFSIHRGSGVKARAGYKYCKECRSFHLGHIRRNKKNSNGKSSPGKSSPEQIPYRVKKTRHCVLIRPDTPERAELNQRIREYLRLGGTVKRVIITTNEAPKQMIQSPYGEHPFEDFTDADFDLGIIPF